LYQLILILLPIKSGIFLKIIQKLNIAKNIYLTPIMPVQKYFFISGQAKYFNLFFLCIDNHLEHLE